MSETPPLPEIHRAVDQLVDLACAVRPDWFRNDVKTAIVAAATAGWGWPRVLVELVRFMVDPEAGPRDLTLAARDPLKHRQPPPPEVAHRGAERVRQVLHGGEAP